MKIQPEIQAQKKPAAVGKLHRNPKSRQVAEILAAESQIEKLKNRLEIQKNAFGETLKKDQEKVEKNIEIRPPGGRKSVRSPRFPDASPSTLPLFS